MVVEERLRPLRGEVGREARAQSSSLGPSCVVAQVLDLQGPDRCAGLLGRGGDQAHPWHPVTVVVDAGVLFLEHAAQPRLVDRPRVVQRRLHPVAHQSVQRVVGEVLAAQLPVLRRVALTVNDGQPVLAHELVIRGLHTVLPALIRAVVERAVVLERSAGQPVVVHDQEVVVRMTALAVDVSHHEGIGVRVHLLREEVAKVVDPLEVLGVVRIELLRVEGLPIVQRLHRATVGFGKRAGSTGP